MDNKISLKSVIEQSFTQYSGAVIQSRALVDVRDCIKPSARQIYYCMFTDKFIHDKPFNKTLKSIGSSMRMYIHGDSSCEGIIMRSGQPFSMRYPLIEIEGSYGNLTESGNWAAPRYTAARLSEEANYLLQETDKFTIQEWADNYDDTEQYPRVLSSLGFYNIVNGSMGIATGIASSIPQFNIREVNASFIKLLKNPNIEFNDIVCYPDFATGGTILNKAEVYQSLKNGTGKGCLIQATIDYDISDNCLVVKDLPYGVYTNTICNEIEKLVNSNESIGITNINDLTGEKVCIKIYLSKKTDSEKIKNYLYDNTSLRKTYGINMTMLDNGRVPKIFGWKEALLAHLNHEKQVYINLYNHRLDILSNRLKIVNALLKAIKDINNVIDVIKKSETYSEAHSKLQEMLNIDEEQAKAILNIKLARLAHLEKEKLLGEKKELENDIKAISSILQDEELLTQKMIQRFKEVSKKFGDERRTKVIQKDISKTNSKSTVAKNTTVQSEPCIVSFNSIGYLQRIPIAQASKTQFDSFKTKTDEIILLFSNRGKMYRIGVKDIKECEPKDKGTAIGAIINLDNDEKIISVFSNSVNEKCPYLFFAMKNGMIKKSEKINYIGNTRNLNGIVVCKKDAGVVSVQETNGNDVILYTNKDMYIRFHADNIRPSGKTAGGIKGINLADNDYVVRCDVIDKEEKSEFISQNRGGKGKRVPV